MPYVKVRDSDDAIIYERQGAKPPDGDGFRYLDFSGLTFDSTVVGDDGTGSPRVDPSKFADGAYSSRWLTIPISDAKVLGGAVVEMTPAEKAARTATTRAATRAAIEAEYKANPPQAVIVGALLAAGVTRGQLDALAEAESDKLTDDELDARA